MPTSLLSYLPAIYQEALPETENVFARHFIACFENILLNQGIEGSIARIPTYLEPNLADPDFLPWLAGWVGLSLRTGLSIDIRRTLVAKIVPYYQRRGTRRGLEEILRTSTSMDTIFVDEPKYRPLQIGEHSKVGEDTYLSGGPPHCFVVKVEFSTTTRESNKDEQLQLVREIVDLEKPAHTSFVLEHNLDASSPNESGLLNPLGGHRGDL